MKIVKHNIVILSSDVLCATLFFLASVLLLSTTASAQGYRVDGVTQARSGFPASAVTIAVCTEPATITTTPCSALTTLYTDSTLATPCTGTLQTPPATSGGAASSCSNPLVADGLGNYHYYVQPGRYALQFYGSGITAYAQRDQVYPCDSTSTCSAFNNVQYVGATSSDIGSQINAAYAACPVATSACHIVAVNRTTANFSTPIIFTTKSKYAILESLFPCIVNIGASFGGCLNYTPTTATAAITIDFYDQAGTNQPIHAGLRNIGLLNGNCTTTGGCASAATGIKIGNTNGGLMDGLMDNVAVYGFGVGYQNTNINATDIHWSNPLFQANTVAEKIGTLQDWTVNGKWIGNGQAFVAPAGETPELHWLNPDFVGNTITPVLDFTVAGGAGNPANYTSTAGHYENGSSTSAEIKYISGNVNISSTSDSFGNDSSSGTSSWYISCSGTFISFSNSKFQSGIAVTQAVLMNSPCRAIGTVNNFSPTNITTFTGGANAAHASVQINIADTANAAALWPIENTLKAPIGIGGTAFTPAANAALHIKYDGTSFNGVRMTDTTTSRESAFGPNTIAANNWSLRDITNSKELFGCDITGVGTCNFPQGLQVAGVPVAGSGFTGVNVTPVTVSTSTTADQNLMALTIAASALNSASRTLLVQLAGVYSTPAGSTAVLTHKLKLCTVSGCGSGTVLTLATWTTAALGAIQVTNDPYNATLNASTQTTGVSAAFEAHGNLTIDLSALTTAAEAVYADNNTATIGTINSTAQLFLQHSIAFSAASASNSATDRQMIADTIN